MTGLCARFLSIAGAALILLFYSELFFLNEGPTKTVTALVNHPGIAAVDLLELAAYYAFFAWGLLLIIPYAERFGLAGIVLAGCLFGWVTEGTVIAIVHEAPPVSWVWPSVSWHALIDVLLGLFVVRIAMRRRGGAALAVLFSAMGVGWGLWATWTWGDPELHRLTPFEFVFFTSISGAIWLAGMILLDRGGPWSVLRAEKWGIGVGTVALALLMAVPGLPLSAGILLIAGATLWVLVRKSEAQSTEGWRLPYGPLPLSTYSVALLAPTAAGLTYWLLWTNGWHVPTEDVAGIAMIVGALVYFWSVWRVFTSR